MFDFLSIVPQCGSSSCSLCSPWPYSVQRCLHMEAQSCLGGPALYQLIEVRLAPVGPLSASEFYKHDAEVFSSSTESQRDPDREQYSPRQLRHLLVWFQGAARRSGPVHSPLALSLKLFTIILTGRRNIHQDQLLSLFSLILPGPLHFSFGG